jgi:PAS domain S-box-containing protein
VLIALLLVFLWLAHSIILPQARERDLNRIKLYTGLARHLLEADAVAGVGTEQTLEKIRRLGLTNPEILPLESIPAGKSPRYVTPRSQVEAWEIFRGPDGQAAGVVRITRWDDTSRWALGILRMAAAILAVGGLLVITATILLTYLPLILSLQRIVAVTRSKFGLPPTNHRRATRNPLYDLELALETATDKVLREDEQRQRLLENHAEAACLGTMDGRLLEVNHAYCRLFGKTREQLVGTSYLDLIPPADRTEVVDSLRKLSPRHPANTMTHRVLSPTGKVLWLRWRDSAIFDDTGAVKEVASFGLDVTAEHELAAQNERLQLAFAQMQSLARTGCLTWDLTRDQMDWTDETWRLLGLDKHASQPSMDQLLAVVTPVDRGPLRELFRRARENGDPFEYEFRCSLPDGSSRTVQSRVEVRADPKTKLLDQLTCTLHDITALRDAESSTKRELRFRQAIEQSLGTGIVVIDENGKCLLVNPAFCEMSGWPAEELTGQLAPYCYWPEEERPAIREAFERTLRGEAAPDGMELRFCRKNGTRFDVLIKVAPLLDNEDRPLGWLGAVTDITSIQQTRRDLQANIERLRIAQDVAEFGIWDWDPVKDTLLWDRQSFALFGHPEATDPQAVWSQVHSEAEQERLTYEINRLIAAGRTSGQDLIRARWPDGSVHVMSSTYLIMRNPSGRATRVLGVNRDITAELEEERNLRDANERLTAVLEGGDFGTFEHVTGVGDTAWSPANYEIHGVDPSLTDPAELFAIWKEGIGDFFPELLARMDALPVDRQHMTYEFTFRPRGKKPRLIRSSIFVERNGHGHPSRLVGLTRRIEEPAPPIP